MTDRMETGDRAMNTPIGRVAVLEELLRPLPRQACLELEQVVHLRPPGQWQNVWDPGRSYLLAYVRHGRIDGRFGSTRVTLTRGGMLLLPPGTAGQVSGGPCTPPLDFTLVRFAIVPHPHADRPDPPTGGVVGCHVRDAPAFDAIIGTLWQAIRWEEEPPLDGLLGGSILPHALARMLLECRRALAPMDERIERVGALLRENPGARYTVAELAVIAGLSPKYFSRCFRELFAASPIAYHVGRRMFTAAEMLDHTDMPVKEIAFELGYPDVSSFSKQFKQHLGLSPSAYRATTARG